MSIYKRLTKVFETAPQLSLQANSKFVLMSDCHRGIGNGADNFAKNQNLYYAALQHYEREGYTYIELGDGDDLWENKHFGDIAEQYPHIFELLGNLYRSGRMYAIYGNHDMVKRNARWNRKNLSYFNDNFQNHRIPLFPGIQIQEGIVLKVNGNTATEILLLHGHQADIFNYDFWRISKFLVRHVWRPMELIGIRDPFSASKNPKRRLSVEGFLNAWATKQGRIIIAGHTHRFVFPKPQQGMYFNDGCAVHPRHITAIEIEGLKISLIKWQISVKQNGVLFVSKEVIAGPEPITDYFTTKNSQSEIS